MPKHDRLSDPAARVYLAGHLAGSLGACCHLAQVATAQLVGEVLQGWVGMCEHMLGGDRAAWLAWAAGVLTNVTEQMAADPTHEVTPEVQKQLQEPPTREYLLELATNTALSLHVNGRIMRYEAYKTSTSRAGPTDAGAG